MNLVYLSLGSNKGNRFLNLVKAILKINSMKNSEVLRLSSFYETEPYGVRYQSSFINQVIEIRTQLNPFELHKNLLEIEKELGRTSKGDYQPREIDIDILFFNDEIIQTENLIIPHPDLHNRRFVLEPLNELNSDLIHPVFKKSVKELLSQLNDKLTVTKFN